MHILHFFFHPDCTVGSGISPDQPKRLAGFTAGGEFHPALKIIIIFSLSINHKFYFCGVLRRILRFSADRCGGKTPCERKIA